MNPMLIKTVASMTALFAAGVVTGVVGTTWIQQAKTEQTPCYEGLSKALTERLARDLALSPEQLEKIRPEICRTSSELTNIHQQTVVEGWDVMKACYRNIAEHLNEEQRQKLQNCEMKQKSKLLIEQEWGRP